MTYIMQIEYVPGEDLFELLDRYGKLDEETAIMLFQQLVDGNTGIPSCPYEMLI